MNLDMRFSWDREIRALKDLVFWRDSIWLSRRTFQKMLYDLSCSYSYGRLWSEDMDRDGVMFFDLIEDWFDTFSRISSTTGDQFEID